MESWQNMYSKSYGGSFTRTLHRGKFLYYVIEEWVNLLTRQSRGLGAMLFSYKMSTGTTIILKSHYCALLHLFIYFMVFKLCPKYNYLTSSYVHQ